MEKISVLIVEDTAEYREGLQWLLSTDPRIKVAGALVDANNISAEVNRLHPQVVLLDYELKDSPDGLAALPLILAAQPDTQVIMLTTFDDDYLIIKSIHLGANGYIVKAKAATELIDHIIMVASGGSPMTGYIARRVLTLMREAGQSQQKSPPTAAQPSLSLENRAYADRLGLLTSRETAVLECLAEGKSYKMIADQLGIAADTVSNHLRPVYRKLQVNSMTEAVAIALRVWLATGKI